MHRKKTFFIMLATSIAPAFLVIAADKPTTKKHSMRTYEMFRLCRQVPATPYPKQHVRYTPSPEEKEQQERVEPEEVDLFIPLSAVGTICTRNENNDPLIQEYRQRDTITKKYTPKDALEFFAYLKKPAITLTSNTQSTSSGSAASHTHGGVISACYWFSTKKYFCSGSIQQPNGLHVLRYLVPGTFDILYNLFQEQERKRIRHEYLEKRLTALAQAQQQAERQEQAQLRHMIIHTNAHHHRVQVRKYLAQEDKFPL